MGAKLAPLKLIIYVLRRDLRLSDNPVFHKLSQAYSSQKPTFTHILPLYVFPAHQVEIAGFIPEAADSEATESEATPKSPYPEARSQVGGFWRCGPHRAKFLAESVWDLKQSLERAGNGLTIRTGMLEDVVSNIIDSLETSPQGGSSSEEDEKGNSVNVLSVWMTADEGVEEKQELEKVRRVVEKRGKELRVIRDEKFFIDDRDLPFESIDQLSDVYTTFRKSLEPLRERPRQPLASSAKLPPLLPATLIPSQASPFAIPDTLDGLLKALLKPLGASLGLPQPPTWADGASDKSEYTQSAHPFTGGESSALKRVDYLLASGAMSAYKDTRNGLIGPDFSTKLSGWLAIGCITARQVHMEMMLFENGFTDVESTSGSYMSQEERDDKLERWKSTVGFGKGEDKGTAGVRFELLWRDYFRLVARKYGPKLFQLQGLRGSPDKKWNHIGQGTDSTTPDKTREVLQRFCAGRTGIGLIDASQREVFLTGYTSNRARQNVASFLAKHLNVDWRLGAEWYECILVDYDVANNWGNWQYVAGVGNDPREGRLFNPVKQALDYDKKGEYIKTWVPELRGLELQTKEQADVIDEERLMGLFQAWRLPESEQKKLGLTDIEFVKNPLVKIQFSMAKRPRPGGGRGRGGGGYRGRGGPSRGRDGPSRGSGGRGRWRTGDKGKAGEAERERSG